MVRKAHDKDILGIQKLIAGNLETLLPRTDSEIAELLPGFYVIEEDGEIVGCCCLEVYSKKIAEIRSVAVRSDKRDKGYGSILVDAAVQDARTLDILEIMVVTSSVPFFEKLGFSSCLNEKYALFWTGKKS